MKPISAIPLSLGIKVLEDRFVRLIDRNTVIPTRKSEIFTTSSDYQTSATIQVLQGEKPVSTENRTLGTFTISDIPSLPKSLPQIEVTFDINKNGILQVQAEDLLTHNSNNIVIHNVIPERYYEIAIVGPTFSGKSSLFNRLFGTKRVTESKGRPDVTDKITRGILPSGLIIYDTPGIGGDEEQHENITRNFIGLLQQGNSSTIVDIPFCKLDFNYLCPYNSKVGQVTIKHCNSTPKCQRFHMLEASNLEMKHFDLTLIVFSLADTLKRSSLSLIRELKDKNENILLVGSKVDKCTEKTFNSLQSYALEKVSQEIIPISTLSDESIGNLVQEVFYKVSFGF